MKQSVKIIVGNWKMNGTTADLGEARVLLEGLADQPVDCIVGLCPPATLISAMADVFNDSPVRVGAQDCHAKPGGAHTGSLSVAMLADAGAEMVIVGHSERRAAFGETDADVAAKACAAVAGGLMPIICVGETLEQREAGRALDVVAAQIDGSVPNAIRGVSFMVAYEPVWAIGTGHTPTLDQIAEVHVCIRQRLTALYGPQGQDVAILYGGSVNPGNAVDILAVDQVGGALVGGASLKAADFLAIIRAA